MNKTTDDGFEPVRQLWAGRFQGVISTHSRSEPGYPFGSTVPYCLDRAGRPLFLFSHLAQHAKNLEADPRCAFTLSEPVPGDIQQSRSPDLHWGVRTAGPLRNQFPGTLSALFP